MRLIKFYIIFITTILFQTGSNAQCNFSFVEISPKSTDLSTPLGTIDNFYYYKKHSDKYNAIIKTDSLFNELASVSLNSENEAGKLFSVRVWNRNVFAFYFKTSKNGISISYQAYESDKLEKSGGLIKLTELIGIIAPDIEKHFTLSFSSNSQFFILVSNIKKKKTAPSFINACVIDSTMKIIRQEEFSHEGEVLTSPNVFVSISNNGSAAITLSFGKPDQARKYVVHWLPADKESFSTAVTSDGSVISDAKATCTSKGSLIIVGSSDPSSENHFSKVFYQIYNSGKTIEAKKIISFSDSIYQFRCTSLMLAENNEKVIVIGKVITSIPWPQGIPPRSISVTEISIGNASSKSTIISADISELPEFLSGISYIFSSYDGNSIDLLYNSWEQDTRYLYYSKCKFERDSCSVNTVELYKYPHKSQVFVYPQMTEFKRSDTFNTYWIMVKPLSDFVITNKVFIKILR